MQFALQHGNVLSITLSMLMSSLFGRTGGGVVCAPISLDIISESLIIFWTLMSLPPLSVSGSAVFNAIKSLS